MAQRVVLIAVDDTDDDSRAMDWTMKNLLRPDDSVHIAHVVPRLTHALQYGAPPIDMAAPVDEQDYQARLKSAQEFIRARFLSILGSTNIEPTVHLIKSEVDNDAIGRVICQKAEQLDAAAVVLAKHHRGRLKEMFMGSVCKHCVQNCQKPVVVVH
eukprot:jgi/Ulvmu1/4652/UM002_0383.1